MTYSRAYPNWIDSPSTSTPATAAKLNLIDQAVYDLKTTPVIYAADYGVVADFVYPTGTDNTAALQAALTAANDVGGAPESTGSSGARPGKIVQLPKGIINFTGALTVTKGTWLRGAGPALTYLFRMGAEGDSVTDMVTVDGSGQMAMVSDMSMTDLRGSATTSHVKVVGGSQALGSLGGAIARVERIVTLGYSTGVWFNSYEGRVVDCYCRSWDGYGLYIEGTDNFVWGCTADTCAKDGIYVYGANNKLTACKGFGCTGVGYSGIAVVGGGRHMLSSCEAQDNYYGFNVAGNDSVLAACLADTNIIGYYIIGSYNDIQGHAMYGGGGSGQVTRVGFDLHGPSNRIRGNTHNCVVPVGGSAKDNDVSVTSNGGGVAETADAATITPDPYVGEVHKITLGGNRTIANPYNKHIGQRLTLIFRQDGTGGRTVTFGARFRTNWTPDTTANRTNVISFEYDGSVWQQTSATTGLTSGALTIADTFTRANNAAIGTSSSGHAWSVNEPGALHWGIDTNRGYLAGTGSSTTFAFFATGQDDYTLQMTLGTGFEIVIVRYTDANNYAYMQGNVAREVVAGVDLVNIQDGYGLTAGDVVTCIVSGPNVRVFRNGVEKNSFTTRVTGRNAGVAGTGSGLFIDDFSIT